MIFARAERQMFKAIAEIGPESNGSPHRSLQTENIFHAVKPRRFSHDPDRGPQRTTRKNLPAFAAMFQFNLFVWAGKDHGVFAHDFTFANRFNWNFCSIVSLPPQNLRNRFCSPTWCILLHLMMGLGNFGVKFRTKDSSRRARQREKRIDADAEIRSENDRDRTRCILNRFTLFGGMSGRANDERDGYFHRRRAKIIRHIRMTDIDRDINFLHLRFDRVAAVANIGEIQPCIGFD